MTSVWRVAVGDGFFSFSPRFSVAASTSSTTSVFLSPGTTNTSEFFPLVHGTGVDWCWGDCCWFWDTDGSWEESSMLNWVSGIWVGSSTSDRIDWEEGLDEDEEDKRPDVDELKVDEGSLGFLNTSCGCCWDAGFSNNKTCEAGISWDCWSSWTCDGSITWDGGNWDWDWISSDWISTSWFWKIQ